MTLPLKDTSSRGQRRRSIGTVERRPSPLAGITLCVLTLSISACAGEPGFEIPTARFESEKYGFSVAYPDTMDLREYIPERTSIGFSAGDGFDAHVEVTVESDSTMTFESLVERAARNSCLADGPGTSIRCTDIERRGTIRAQSGERGEVLYLTLEMSEVPSGRVLETMPRGPYIAFDHSSQTGATTVLFVRAPITRQLRETNVDLVLNVARSLRIED